MTGRHPSATLNSVRRAVRGLGLGLGLGERVLQGYFVEPG
jgi:hypothetical protein